MIGQMVIESPQARVPSGPRAEFGNAPDATRELFLRSNLMEPATGLPVMGAATKTEKRHEDHSDFRGRPRDGRCLDACSFAQLAVDTPVGGVRIGEPSYRHYRDSTGRSSRAPHLSRARCRPELPHRDDLARRRLDEAYPPLRLSWATESRKGRLACAGRPFQHVPMAGAGGRTRTGTGLPPTDFKSVASTIPPRPRAAFLASQRTTQNRSGRHRRPLQQSCRCRRALIQARRNPICAPDLVPVAAVLVGDAAVLGEELVRDLEHRDHQPALRRPGGVAAARLAPDELAGPTVSPSAAPSLSTSLPEIT